MSHSFFNLDSQLPPLGAGKDRGELLTSDVEEEEYDALNDETFGDGALEGDWEQDHETLTQLDEVSLSRKASYDSPYLDESSRNVIGKDEDLKLHGNSLWDGSHQEIVEKSISHLGLEDDLDDPAIVTLGKMGQTRPVESKFGPSPPPPAILDSDLCGSPKTHTIWSPSSISSPENAIGSLLQSLHLQTVSTPLKVLPNAHTLEEVERDSLNDSLRLDGSRGWVSPGAVHAEMLERELMSSSPPFSTSLPPYSTPTRSQGSGWISPTPMPNQQGERESFFYGGGWVSPTPPLPLSGGVRTLDDVEKDILLRPRAQTMDEVERHLHSASPSSPRPIGTPSGTARQSVGSHPPQQFPIGTPPQGVRLFPMVGNHPITSSPVPVVPLGGHTSPVLIPGGSLRPPMPPPPSLPPHPILNPPRLINPFPMVPALLNNMNRNHMPFPMQGPLAGYRPRGPGVSPADFRMQPGGDLRRLLYPRHIHHPLLNKLPPKNHLGWQWRSDDARRPFENGVTDEYAGLMTQREKDWLIRIQLLQLQTENPEVEDYYYSKYVIRRTQKGNAEKDKTQDRSGERTLPERMKLETRTYVPMQFENSLGKLQVVSVNYPRRILDLEVQKPPDDDESRASTNRELRRYRRLLLDIERLYTTMLEVTDLQSKSELDEKEAKEDTLRCLVDKLFTGLFPNGSSDDKLYQVALVRKGKTLITRSFLLFSKPQQMAILTTIFRNLTPILRKDQNDRVFFHHRKVYQAVILDATLGDAVALGQALQNASTQDAIGRVTSPSREKSHFTSAFQNQFGAGIVCDLLARVERLYSSPDKLDPILEAAWSRVVLHIADVLCSVPSTAFLPSSQLHESLLSHFQRFPIERGKFETVTQKLSQLHAEKVGDNEA